MNSSKVFLYFCLSFIAGIFVSPIIFKLGLFTPHLFISGGLISGIILISVLWKYKKIVLIGFCMLFMVLGVWRHSVVELRIMNYELRNYNNLGKEIVLTGIIIKEPDIKGNSVKLTIETRFPVGNRVSAKISAIIPRYPEYKYGDELEITGILKEPSENIGGFNYKSYLAKDGIFSIMEWPKIELLKENQGSIFYKYLFSLKNKLKGGLNQFLSPPQSGLLEALFFGDEENISKDWKDKFNLTGTRHITAVSGMNITIVSALLLNSLLFLGFWRNQAFYVSVILIIFYILMIGAPASAVRAGVMGCLFLLAQRLGRPSMALRAVIFASVFMLFLNPLLLRFDVGFQLSFLAVLGLIYFQPFFLDFFKKIPNTFQIRYAFCATLAAQIFTSPILIYNFGRISLISPLVNILIVPLLSIVTVLGFIFSFFSMIFPVLGWLFSFPVWFFLTYILKAIDFFSHFPFASIALENIHWIWLILFYLFPVFFAWHLSKKEKLKFLFP